jgi:hypothetical protein
MTTAHYAHFGLGLGERLVFFHEIDAESLRRWANDATPRPPPRGRKRSRAIADVDSERSCIQKKKQRLRLFFITSPLSPQFSYPATNIVDRGGSKIAVWAKQKALGRNLLRKAAILNYIRRRAGSAALSPDPEGIRNHTPTSSVESPRSPFEIRLHRDQLPVLEALSHGSTTTDTNPHRVPESTSIYHSAESGGSGFYSAASTHAGTYGMSKVRITTHIP